MFAMHLLLALAPLFGLVIDCVFHVAVSRYAKGVDSVRAIIIGVLAGLVAEIIISCFAVSTLRITGSDCAALLALNALTYLALAYGYIGYVGLNLTSLRIKILKLMWEAGGSLPREVLSGLYNNKGVATERIDAMLRGGYLVEREGRLFTGNRTIVVIAAIWDSMRRVVLGKNCPAFPSAQSVRTHPRPEMADHE